MNNYKNSPLFISLYIALFNFFIVFTTLFLGDFPLSNVVVFSVLSFIVIWVFGYSLIEFLIQKNISNIYKLILKTKVSRQRELTLKHIRPEKYLNEVEADIKHWAQQHSDELEFYKKLSSYKKEFLQNLSHEIRTPLFSIQAYCEAIQEDLGQSKVSKNFKNNFSVIIRNVERLSTLISDVNQINQLENNQIILHKSEFNLHDLLQEILEDFKFLIKEKNIKTHTLYENKKINIYADRDKIKQVLNNLIENAIKYNPDSITISFGIKTIDDKNFAFEVGDNGKGIEEIHLERIFDRFYRIGYDRSRALGGMGLGLSICKHIMELHDSYISVRSGIGVGTTFSIGLNVK